MINLTTIIPAGLPGRHKQLHVKFLADSDVESGEDSSIDGHDEVREPTAEKGHCKKVKNT